MLENPIAQFIVKQELRGCCSGCGTPMLLRRSPHLLLGSCSCNHIETLYPDSPLCRYCRLMFAQRSFGPLPGSCSRRQASGGEQPMLPLLWRNVRRRLPPACSACRRPSRRLQLPAKQSGWHPSSCMWLQRQDCMPGSTVMMFCNTVQTLPHEDTIGSCKLALTLPLCHPVCESLPPCILTDTSTRTTFDCCLKPRSNTLICRLLYAGPGAKWCS